MRPTNHLYDVLVNYRYYRLKRRSSTRTGRETGKVKDHIRRLATAVNGLKFDGSDPIAILNFLTRFTEEADILEMKESQAFIALPHFLAKTALEHYRAARDASPREGGVTAWPEAVQYLLRNYATNDAISEALLVLRDIRQSPAEDETAYSTRLMAAELRCGNVHSTEEKMTMFIDGLDPGIRSLVARHREGQRDKTRGRGLFTYLDLVRFAQNEGDALRARRPRLASKPPDPRVSARRSPLRGNTLLRGQSPTRGRAPNLLLDSPEDSRLTRSAGVSHPRMDDELYLLPDDGIVATSDVHSTVETAEPSDSAMLVQGHNRIPAPRVPHQGQDRATRFNRPGWVDNRRVNAKPDRPQALVCYSCYALGHTSPDCVGNSNMEPERVMRNFQSLSPSAQQHVPADSYWRAKALNDIIVGRVTALRQASNPVQGPEPTTVRDAEPRVTPTPESKN